MARGLTKRDIKTESTRRGNLHRKKTYVERDIYGKKTQKKMTYTKRVHIGRYTS